MSISESAQTAWVDATEDTCWNVSKRAASKEKGEYLKNIHKITFKNGFEKVLRNTLKDVKDDIEKISGTKE